MANRWMILAVLFLARTTMAFQFQSVAALSPLIIESYAVTLADVGLLIGLYLAPGVVVSLPGGAIAARYGDKLVVALAMAMMLAGGVLIALAPGWGALVTGRLLAGAGGVVMNIVMTKMLVDWFAGREISTAMAVFVNSWPLGIALALVTLPVVAGSGGLLLAWWAAAAIIAASLFLFASVYHAPDSAMEMAGEVRAARLPFFALFLAGMVWALYNAALAMVFGFGPAVLIGLGWSLATAGSAISLFMLVIAASAPLGGILADRTGRRDGIILASLASFAALMPLVLFVPPWAVTAVLVMVGALSALAAGPIMMLPSLVLSPTSRAFGMGVFFTIYYGVMMIAPRIAGSLADRSANAGVTVLFGVAMALACILALGLFRRAIR